MSGAKVAVIGGSGFYEMEGVAEEESIDVDTPFGAPSDRITLATLDGARVAFLPRHGTGHRILPHEVPSRANIWALASLGVERIFSVSAVGSLQEQIAPMEMVVPDQLIDRTAGRPSTFFGEGLAAHIAFDEPFCPQLSRALVESCAAAAVTAHDGGTLVVIQGPAFSTRAESELYRAWGADVIGMTALPEAKLAREARICYATLTCVTDYDTWHPGHDTVTAGMIIRNLRANVANARAVVRAAVAAVSPARQCACAQALDNAIVTPLSLVPEATLRALAPILSRELEAAP
jgi:5'-methylthioadenosine phosphorylase